MKDLFWVGPRESDIAYTGDMFEASATYYGSDEGSNCSFCGNSKMRINHNTYSEEASCFISDWQMDKIDKYPECRFMSYNPNCVIGAREEIVRRTLCLNEEHLMKCLDNKLELRKIAQGVVPLLNAKLLKGKDCTWENLARHACFLEYDSFVIQETVASGGQGTYLMAKNNVSQIVPYIDPDKEYLVSGYLARNISVNVHAVIYDNDIVFLPASVQIIRLGSHRLLYRGADFIAYGTIAEELREKFLDLSRKITQKIQRMGYRGVLGIDAIISGKEIYFLEINNRFQGSSVLINKALEEYGMKSLQQMNYDAFYEHFIDEAEKEKIEGIHIQYSLYNFVNELGGIHSEHIMEAALYEKTVVSMEKDGYMPEQEAEPYASQFALIFHTNILSLCDKDEVARLHPNVGAMPEEWHKKIMGRDWSAIKVSLINRGAVLSEQAVQFIDKHGKMRLGTYCSLDLYMEGIYINCPLYIKLVALSPFRIDIDESNQGLCLKYYGKCLSPVDYDVKKPFAEDRLSNGSPVGQICFLATDRLRLQNNAFCTFSAHGCACRFCEADAIRNDFGEKEILEAIDVAFATEPLPFRHILIGGMSNDIGNERPVIMRMCKKIREHTDMPVYLMCLPPDIDAVEDYYKAGVNEFGFNLEIYDRQLAKRYMPGKGYIPLKKYYDAMDAAVSCVGRNGAVRCAFIAGLEPMDSLLEGVEEVCKRGVVPILSAFRPIPGTKMQEVIPPSDEWLYELMEKAECLCNKYGLSLGPKCPACRNNTLSFVHTKEVEQLYSLGWKRE